MEKRPTFSNIKSDYYTHCHDLPPQLGGCVSIPDAEKTAANIDGKDDSWKLPLDDSFTGPAMEPLDADKGPEKSSRDRLEAATRLIGMTVISSSPSLCARSLFDQESK